MSAQNKDNDLINPLKVGDVDFLVTSAIERCPSTMMARELAMNAIEAAKKDISGKGEVRIIAKNMAQFPGVPKLAIWNNGPGMTDTDLLHIGNIAASLKPLGLDKNFGMGAKVASLNVNHFGLRYRSCCNGIVHQIVLGKIGDVFGFLRQPLGDGTLETVLDVTDMVKNEGEYPLTSDWTEVTLLGNRADQNTVIDPYGNGKAPRQWLIDALYHRFYRIPSNVTIMFEYGTHARDNNRTLFTIDERISSNKYGQFETVTTPEGLKIHYVYDPPLADASGKNKSYSGYFVSTPAHVAIVYRDEMYDVNRSTTWSSMAPEFGVSFGSRHVVIHVELPDDFGVMPEGYRRFLQLDGGDQHQIEVREFAGIVRENMPEWLAEIIRGYGPKPSTSANAIERELQDLLNRLSVGSAGLRVQTEGDCDATEGNGRGEAPAKKRNNSSNPDPKPGNDMAPTRYQEVVGGAKRAAHAQTRETAPKIHWLDADEQIEERDLVNRATRYVQASNELFINCQYQVVEQITDFLHSQFAGVVATLGDKVRVEARAIAINVVTTRSGRAVVFAKAKMNAHAWSSDNVDQACTPECLSIVCDDWNDVAGDAVSELRMVLGLSARQARSARAA
jgi:hypothetical protein